MVITSGFDPDNLRSTRSRSTNFNRLEAQWSSSRLINGRKRVRFPSGPPISKCIGGDVVIYDAIRIGACGCDGSNTKV